MLICEQCRVLQRDACENPPTYLRVFIRTFITTYHRTSGLPPGIISLFYGTRYADKDPESFHPPLFFSILHPTHNISLHHRRGSLFQKTRSGPSASGFKLRYHRWRNPPRLQSRADQCTWTKIKHLSKRDERIRWRKRDRRAAEGYHRGSWGDCRDYHSLGIKG